MIDIPNLSAGIEGTAEDNLNNPISEDIKENMIRHEAASEGQFYESVIPQEEQEFTGWYWHPDKKAYFRYSDWNKSIEEIIGERNNEN